MAAISPLQAAPGRLPPGERVYAIGDVHGCADRLRVMHGLIATDLERFPASRVAVVHLGDVIDRGPDSAGALALVRAPPGLPEGHVLITLLGNHEQMMRDAYASDATEETRAYWLVNGGDKTLRSWGVRRVNPSAPLPPPPNGVLAFLAARPLTYRSGDYLFVHAGVRPGLALDQQDPFDLLWIRAPFLTYGGDLGAIVVHGHTPAAAAEIRANRIGLDTGAVRGGALTCGVLEADTIRFLVA